MIPIDPDSIPTSPLPPLTGRREAAVHSGTGQSWSVTPALHGAFVAPTPAELAPHFPSLEIMEQLGQGGMGAVYKARQKSLDRIVAVKILPPHWAKDPQFAERFTREARALARLNHPNVVTVYDSGQTAPTLPAGVGGTESGGPGLFYFIMEYVDGPSLRALMKTGRLAKSQVVELASQLCEGLSYAHDAGLVHRDIKPENVLLDQRLRIKIADFGLSKLMDPANAAATTLTRDGARLGTPQYMAPEQYDSAAAADKRVDIFATGVMLYEMLTGELPMGRFDPPSAKGGGDAGLDAIVLKALEQNPSRRYQSAAELSVALNSTRLAAADSPASTRKRLIARVSITVIVLLAMAGLILKLTSRSSPSGPDPGPGPALAGEPGPGIADNPPGPPQPPGPRRGPGGPNGPGGEGPPGMLPDMAARMLGVTGPNRAQVDKALADALREAVRLERARAHVSVDAGKVVVHIENHAADAKALADKTKAEIAKLLDEDQRKRLENTPKAMLAMFDGEPGQERTVTMWKDGEQYHFDEVRDGKSVRSGAGPSSQVIPSRYRGFWAVHGSDYEDLAQVIAEAGARLDGPRKRGQRVERPKLISWIQATPNAESRLRKFLEDAGVPVQPSATPAQLSAALERLARSMQGVVEILPDEP